VAGAGIANALVDMSGDVFAISVNDVARDATISVLNAPEGMSLGPVTHTSGIFSSLMSSMRVRVPMTEGVVSGDRDYVKLEDVFTTKGADVAALFYVVEDPAHRVSLDSTFEVKVDALSAFKQMVTGSTLETSPFNIADIIDASTSVSVSWDERYAKMGAYGDAKTAVYYDHTTGALSTGMTAAEVDAYARDHPAFKTSPVVNSGKRMSDQDRQLVTELVAISRAIEHLDASEGKKFVAAAITSLSSGAGLSDRAAAYSLVDTVIKHCVATLGSTAFVEEVRVAGISHEDRAILTDALKAIGDHAEVASLNQHLPHISGAESRRHHTLCKHAKNALTLTQFEALCRHERVRREDEYEYVDQVWQFQLLFWTSVILVSVTFFITCQIGSINPGYDSIIYRMTPGPMLR